MPKGRAFILQRYLLYEGHIRFLGDPSTACGKNSVPEEELYSPRGNWHLAYFRIIALKGISGGLSSPLQVTTEKYHV